MINTIALIKSDLYRYTGKVGFKTFIINYFYNRSFKYSLWYRLSKQKGVIGFFSKVKLKLLIWSTGIDIPPGVVIGSGLYIGHGQSIVINPTTIIGDNCNISQFVSIGANEGNAAIIGSNVYIGPNVCIVENVRIGNNVTIGAGAVVTKDIPDNATVAGAPARVLNFNNPGRYIHYQWK